MSVPVTWLLLTLCVVAFLFSLVLGARRLPRALERLRPFATVVQVAALAGAYLVLRPGAGVDGEAAVQAGVAQARPVFLDFFSNY